MNVRIVSVVGLLIGAGLLPAYSASPSCKCVMTGPAVDYLKDIGLQAARAQNEANEMSAYLDSAAFPDVKVVGDQMAYLAADIKALRADVARLESTELSLTPDQTANLERLKTGIAVLPVFLNRVNQLLEDSQMWAHRAEYLAEVRNIETRCGLLRQAADHIRIRTMA